MEVTTTGILDKRRMLKKTQTYHLAIRVTYGRKPVPFPLDLHLSESDWEKLSSPRLGEELSQVRKKFKSEQKRADEIIKDLPVFSFPAFRQEFYKDRRKNPDKIKTENAVALPGLIEQPEEKNQTAVVISVPPSKTKFRNQFGKRKYPGIKSEINFEALGQLAISFGKYIKLLEAQERISTVLNYMGSLMSLLAFQKNLKFSDLTIEFMYRYEKWMIRENKTYATVGFYLRPLRSVFNMAIDDKMISRETYPFGRRRYIIPTGRNIKKAIQPADIKRIYDHKPVTKLEAEVRCKDLWFFLFFGNGMNVKDMAQLKFKNIDGDFIRFIRAKTHLTTRTEPITISVCINEDMSRAIKLWGNKDTDPDNYIFPILTPGLSAYRQRELINLFIKLVNEWIDLIAKEEGIKIKIRTMNARHSFATILRNSGVSTEFIKEALGHANAKTTENYFAGFEDATNKQFVSHLTAFKSLPDIQKTPALAV